MTRRISKPILILAAGTAVCAGVGTYAWYESHRPQVLEMHIYDTPGSPSVFVRTPQDSRILVGGGANADIIRRITEILPFYSRRIDMLIVPVADAAHVTGLVEAVSRYSIGKVIVPAVTLYGIGIASSTDPAYLIFIEAAQAAHIPIEESGAGDSLVLDAGSPGLKKVIADILFPVHAGTFAYSGASAPELLMRISYGATSAVFMGGASPKIQKFIASTSASADAAIFSQSASSGNISPEIIRALHPAYLIYAQSASHPAKVSAAPARKKAGVLAGFMSDHSFNIKEKGEVKIISDGTAVQVI